jgi:hypothetical protein
MAEARRDRSVADESAKSRDGDVAARLSGVAERLEALNEQFGGAVVTPLRAAKRS